MASREGELAIKTVIETLGTGGRTYWRPLGVRAPNSLVSVELHVDRLRHQVQNQRVIVVRRRLIPDRAEAWPTGCLSWLDVVGTPTIAPIDRLGAPTPDLWSTLRHPKVSGGFGETQMKHRPLEFS